MKIIHISDLHIDSSKNKFALGRFNNIVDDIISKKFPEDTVIVMTGDLTNNGFGDHTNEKNNPAYFGVSKLEANGYQDRVLVIPGNHDYGIGVNVLDKVFHNSLITDFKKTFYNDENATYPRITNYINAVFVGLDSTIGVLKNLKIGDAFTSQGEIEKKQLDILSDELQKAKASGKKTIVYLHHHPFSSNSDFKLNNAKEFLEIVDNSTDVLLFGHIHYEKNDGDDRTKDTQIPRVYNAGSSTNINDRDDWTSHYRVIDLDSSPENDSIVVIPIHMLTLDNSHGGTYIAHGNLTYTVNDEARQQDNTASGGLTSTLEVPELAQNIKYTLTFDASDTKITFAWDNSETMGSKKYIDVKGVWPGSISAIERDTECGKLELNNQHGGTYIAHGTLTYMYEGKSQKIKNSASGGLKSTIKFPTDATDIKYNITYDASKTTSKFSWTNGWTGTRHIDVKGVWPGKVKATDNGIK